METLAQRMNRLDVEYRALFGDAPQLRMLEAIEGDLQTALDRIQAAIDTKKPLDLPQETDAAAELFSAQT